MYWLEQGARVARVTPSTKNVEVIAQGPVIAMAVDADWMVWAAPGYAAVRTRAIGEPPSVHVTKLDSSLVLRGNAFWLSPADGRVVTCPTPCTGTTAAALVESPKLLAAGATKIFYFGIAPGGSGVSLFWTPAALGSDEPQGPLATQQDPRLITVGGSRVFWVNADGSVATIAEDGGASPETLATIPSVTAITADASALYVATPTQILKLAVTGGAQSGTPVATVSARPVSMVTVGSDLVWASEDKTLRRVAK